MPAWHHMGPASRDGIWSMSPLLRVVVGHFEISLISSPPIISHRSRDPFWPLIFSLFPHIPPSPFYPPPSLFSPPPHPSSLSISLSFSLPLCLIMGEPSASYIHTVQHLIEKCLLYRMNKEECMEALNKHANIKPVITSTVWVELEKENREFFAAYAKEEEEREREKAAMQRMQKIVADDQECAAGTDHSDDDDQ